MGRVDDIEKFDFESLIDISDLESIKLEIKLFNLVSGTPVKDDQPIRVIQFLDSGFLVEVKKGNCAINHHMALEVKAYSPKGQKIEFKATAKVESARNLYEMNVDSLIESRDLILLRLLQYNENQLKHMYEIFSQRQVEIENFLLAARGLS